MGDAVLCTPALRALYQALPQTHVTLLGNRVNRELLSGGSFFHDYVTLSQRGFWSTVRQLRSPRYSDVVLFKNSLGSALICRLAGIPQRWGYAREGRGILLTRSLQPPRQANGAYRPGSMVEYYMALARALGAQGAAGLPELTISPQDEETLDQALPELKNRDKSLVILVPGGAFGASKCWSPHRYAQVADWLGQNKNAQVVISVAPNSTEQAIAQEIVASAHSHLLNLGQRPLTLGSLKALLGRSDLVITNDTGPRHIAIALRRKVITLFGPNDPAWTQTGWDQEISLIGRAPCAPCGRPECTASEHFCMDDITVEQVCATADSLLRAP